MTPTTFPAFLALTMMPMSALHAHIFFDNTAGTFDFGTAANWNTDLLPSAAGTQNAFIGGNQDVVFSGTMTTVGEVQVGTDANPYGLAGIPGGRASLTLNSGANLTLGGSLVVGQGLGLTNNSGTLQVNTGASLNLSGNSRILLGFYDNNDSGSTTGTLHINGGTVTKTGTNGMEIGGQSGVEANNYGQGILLVDSGTLNTTSMVVGWNGGTGSVTQTGGNVNVSGFFTMGLGRSAASNSRHGSGIYNMTGGTFTSTNAFTIQEVSDLATITSSFNQSGGTVNLNGSGTNSNMKAIGRSTNGTGIYNLSGDGILNTANGDLQLGAVNTGATGVLNVSGTSQLNISGVYALAVGRVANSTGTVTQSAGAVNLAATSDLGVWLGATAGASATYNLNGGTLTTPNITPAAVASTKAFNFGGGELIANKTMTIPPATTFTTTVNAGGAKINTAAFNVTWNPALVAGTGSGGLTKSGSGALILNGSNTYTGATLVNNGTLVINGNISTSILTTVASGATVAGSGATGALTILSNGTLTPGNSIESLDVNGDLTLASGSFSAFEIDTSGDLSDLVTVSGLLVFGGTLNVTNIGGAFIMGDTFDLFNFDSANSSGSFSAVNLPILADGLIWDQSSLYSSGQLAVIPEPSTALLGGLTFVAILRRRRCKS